MGLCNNTILLRDLKELSIVCKVLASRDLRTVIVEDVRLPPGWNRTHTRMRIQIPEDYPLSPPGVSSSPIFLETGLRYHGQVPRDYHKNCTVAEEGWAWLCYESIDWAPNRDNLISLLERVRADLTNPRL